MCETIRKLPAWYAVLERWMPTAPTTYIAEEKTPDRKVWGYTIGGRGWADGGRDRRVHKTRLGAIVATWEWWLMYEGTL